MTDTTSEALASAYPPRRQAWLSAVVIFVITAIAMADRMAISMLVGSIKSDFGIGDFEASLLIGFAFTLLYAVVLLPLGAAADRYSRPKVLAICLAIWSLATVLCGFATGFVSLFVARMVVGIGEASVGPCSHGIIGASFPRHELAKPLALQTIGFQVGPALGVAAAGAILSAGAAGAFDRIPLLGDLAPWRVAFILIGLPGLLALLLVPFLSDPDANRRNLRPDIVSTPVSFLPFLRENWLLMGLMLTASGVSAMVAGGVIIGWVPEYLQRVLRVSPLEAGGMMGLILLSSAVIGQGIFAFIVDRVAARGALDAPIRIGLLPAAVAVPLAWFAFEQTSARDFYFVLFAFSLAIAPFGALNNTVAQQIAPAALRSRMSALFIFVTAILGFAIGPVVVGSLSEFVLGEARLGDAMQIVGTAAAAITFVLLWFARKQLVVVMTRKEAEA